MKSKSACGFVIANTEPKDIVRCKLTGQFGKLVLEVRCFWGK